MFFSASVRSFLYFSSSGFSTFCSFSFCSADFACSATGAAADSAAAMMILMLGGLSPRVDSVCLSQRMRGAVVERNWRIAEPWVFVLEALACVCTEREGEKEKVRSSRNFAPRNCRLIQNQTETQSFAMRRSRFYCAESAAARIKG